MAQAKENGPKQIQRLSCADQRMVSKSKPMFNGQIFTRPDWNEKLGVDAYPPLPYQGTLREDDPWHWNSGPHAINVGLATSHAGWFKKTANLCFLIGFDLTQNSKSNNVYKNTEGYDDKVIDPKYWHYQINKMIELHPKVSFVWVAPNNYDCPQEWQAHSNFERDSVNNFITVVDLWIQNKRFPDLFKV